MLERNNTLPEVTEAVRDLVIANRILGQYGVVDGFGHVSVRDPRDPNRYLMSRSRAPELVTREDIVLFDLDNNPVHPEERALYAERPIHGCIYQARPDVMAVCHNHSHDVIPFGITSTPLRPILHMAAVIGEQVPVWDIRDEFGDSNLLVTKADEGASLARCLGAGRVVLMRGHGCTVATGSLPETVFTAYYLGVNAKLLMQSLALSQDITYLSPGEVAQATATLTQPLSQDRAWQGWCAKAGYSGL